VTVWVDLGDSYYFTTYEEELETFIFAPVFGDRGDYLIYFTMTDDDDQKPLTSEFELEVEILPIDLAVEEVIALEVAAQSGETVVIGGGTSEVLLTNQELLFKQYYQKLYSNTSMLVEYNETEGTLDVYIDRIDLYGRVDIHFETTSLFIPSKYYFINEEVLYLYVR